MKLPIGYYFGISAGTGELSDNHDIISVKFYQLEENSLEYADRANIIPSAPPAHRSTKRVTPADEQISKLKSFTVFLFIVLVVLLFTLITIKFYYIYKKSSRKFY